MIVNSLAYLTINFNLQGLIVLLLTSILNTDDESFTSNAYLCQPEMTAGLTNI